MTGFKYFSFMSVDYFAKVLLLFFSFALVYKHFPLSGRGGKKLAWSHREQFKGFVSETRRYVFPSAILTAIYIPARRFCLVFSFTLSVVFVNV